MSDQTDNVEKFDKIKRILSTKWAFLGYGILGAAVLLLSIRFITYNPHETHYHANFAVYINGTREAFKDPQYYEEVKVCSLHGTTPQARTHMHDEENGVIHVHDDAVTWSDFFNNLGWSIGPDFIRTLDTLYVADDTNHLNIMLNGENLTGLTSIANQVISDKDRLLISLGDEDQTALDRQYKTVPNTAGDYDAKPDPASCAGAHEVTTSDRFKNLL